MTIRRRSLRKALILVGCLVGSVKLLPATVGGLLIILGAVLHLWSKGCLEQNRTLTTAGPYRFTRNPFYLANLLIDLGLCFVIGQLLVAWLCLPFWWIAYRDTIAREQERLMGLFPDEYPDYLAQVPLLIPNGNVWPIERVTGQFSWTNDGLARGAEFARVLGIFIGPLAICVTYILRNQGLSIMEGRHTGLLVVCLMLPVLWIWKLALAETFRSPKTRLVPAGFAQRYRSVLMVGLAIVIALLLWGNPWAALLPVLWLGILLLDELGDRRAGEPHVVRGPAWSYFPVVAAGSLAGFGFIWVLVPIYY